MSFLYQGMSEYNALRIYVKILSCFINKFYIISILNTVPNINLKYKLLTKFITTLLIKQSV